MRSTERLGEFLERMSSHRCLRPHILQKLNRRLVVPTFMAYPEGQRLIKMGMTKQAAFYRETTQQNEPAEFTQFPISTRN